MLFGHNSDVKIGETVYHVQTEDRGVATAMIDTSVYCRGRVLHRRTNNYLDLLPLGAQHEAVLRKRIDDQHRGTIEDIRSGALHLPPPPSAAENQSAKQTPSAGAAPDLAAEASSADALVLELLNPKNWLAGKRVNLQIAVRQKQNGTVAGGARVIAHIEGASSAKVCGVETGTDGVAKLDFEMPQLTGAEPVLIIEATHSNAKGRLKFQLRSRSRVPTA